MTKSFSKRLRLFVLALFSCILCAGLVLGAACSNNKNKGGVTLDRYEVIMYVGDVEDINASGEDKNGKAFSAFDYEWSFTGDDCITIEKAGSGCRITAVSEGSATITVEAGNFIAKCDVVVKNVAVEKVTLDKDTLELDLGAEDTITAKAELNSKKNYDGEYSWEITEGKDFVEITPDGASCTVTAKAAGTAKITVTAEGKSATCIVTVTSVKVHTHEYEASSTWSADYTACEITLTCKNSDGLCDDAKVVIPTEDVTVDSTEVKADCTTAGSITYTATVTYEGKEYTVTETVETEPATGHTFPAQGSTELKIEWKWEERDETTCTVEVLITCLVCEEKISFTADYTTEDETTLSGTLTVGNNTYNDEYTVDVGHVHSYGEPQWTWSGDYSTAEAVFTCTDANCLDEDGNKTVTLTADVEVSEEGYKAATCGEAGSCRFVATAEFGGVTYTDTTADVEIPATGLHTAPDENDDTNVVWSWDTSSSVPTAGVKITCSVCGAPLYDGSAQVSPIDDGFVNPGCDTTGTRYYDGTVSFVLTDGTQCSYTDKAFVTLDPLGHTYPDPQTQGDLYHWTFPGGEISEGTEVTITAECSVCHQTIETFTTTITKIDTVDATATDNGSITYSAVVQIDGQDVTLTFVEILTAEGHTYPGDYDTTYVVWGWENMDTQNHTVSYAIYCADDDSFLLTEGTATYSTETKEPTCDVAGSTVYTATVTVSADGTAHTYSGKYSVEIPAIGHSWTENFYWSGITDIEETESGTVQVTLTCSVCGTTETHEATYTRTEYVASTCNDAGYMTFTATLSVEDVDEPFTSSTTVTLPLSEEHTYPEDGLTNIVWDWGSRDEDNSTVKLTVYCTVCGKAIIENCEVDYITNQAGTYWEATYSDGTHTYTSSYPIPQEEETDVIVEVDFNGGSFSNTQTAFVTESEKDADGKQEAPGSAAVVDKDKNQTGFTAMGEADDSKTIQIGSSSGYTYLAFNGSASTTKNTVSYYLDAGAYKVEISYFSGSSGRWATVLNSSGKDLDELIAEEDKTSGSGEIKTRTIYFRLDTAQNIYIGSKNSGLYITYIGIYTVESLETKTVIGVALDEASIQLEMGSSVVISAVAELSDGKHYLGYTDAEYSWDISGDGSVTYTGSGDNITVTGVSLGQVVVTVTVNGTYTAYCEIEIIEKVVYDITSLTIDFSDSDTYSWIDASNTSNDYSYWIVTLVHGWSSIGSGRLNTGGGSSTNNGRYFILDLSDYIGQTLTFTVDFESSGTSSQDRSICLDTQCSSAGSITSSTTLAYATSNISGDRQKLEYSGVIENEVLYLTYSGNINIYSIEISIDSGDPTVMGVTLSNESVVVNEGDTFTITADVRMNFGTYEGSYVWEVVGESGIVETDYSAGETTNVLTVTAVGEGTVTITLTVGEYTTSCKVTVYPYGESIYETVTTLFDYASPLAFYGSGNGPASGTGYMQGIFTVSGGAKFYDGYINTQGNDIIITMSGIDNTISFTGTGASSSANPLTVSLYKDGENITPDDWSSVNLAGSAYSYFYVSGLGAGTYTIKTNASVRIENLTVTQSLPVSDPDNIIVTASNVDFLKGRDIDVNDLGLNIILHYENGREDPLTVSEVSVAFDSDLSEGAHAVTVTYNYDDNKGNQAEFSATVYIYIYSVASITISDFSMEYTGGTYYTNNVQKIFLVGDSINYDYAAVTALASCTYNDAESGTSKTITKEFVLTSDEVYFSTDANMYTVGTYTVTATVNMGISEGDAKTATYQINVVTKEGADITTVNVNKTATFGMDKYGVYTVNTINDAIMLIKLLGASDAERKFIYVAAGGYNEKIYIDIPNLSLIGSNPTVDENDNSLLATRSEATEIVYDAMNGVMDPSGTTTYSTVGSATVTVASQATGFYAANITFRNYWNTNDLYNEALTITSSTQADAAYINADQSYFYNVTFTGYHDTLEAENGRQVYDHCYIEGRTDYIFGSTATCYFFDCTIHSIGAGTGQANGGYVVAYKGNGNAGTVDYGYIFDGCNFEGDKNVKEHSVALGRAWGEDMMMVIMNSTFDSSFAMGGYTGASSALRYCQMNYDPDFTKIFEYNNTGDSAIDSTTDGYSVDGNNLVSDSNGNPVFTIPTNPSIYSDMSVIFAATNGSVSYDSAWDGECNVITITVMGNSGLLTTVYGTGSMSVSDLKTAINVRLDETEVDKIYEDGSFSAELTGYITSDTTVYISIGEKDMTVPASVTYDFYGREGDSDDDVSGWYDYLYVDLGTNGSFKSNKSGWYMLTNDATITVKLSAGSTISVQMYESDKILVNGSSVTGIDDGSGTYWYTLEVGETQEIVIGTSGTLYIRTIEIVVPVIYQIGDTIYLNDLDSSDGSYNVSAGGTGSYKGMDIEGYFRNNGNSFQVDVGTVIKIQSVPGATAKLSFYQDAYWVEADIVTDSEGLITITITSKSEQGGYISSIKIVDDGGDSVIYQIGDEISFVDMDNDDIYSNVGGYEYKGIAITGTFRNNSNSVQVAEGTTIQIQSTPDASAEVIFYQDYTGDYQVSTDEDGLITIVFTGDTGSSGIYLTGINIITNPDYEGSGDEPEDLYAGSITFNPGSLTVEEGTSDSFTFEVSITKNGEEYSGTDIDITVQSNDTGIAVESWNQSTNTVTITGVSEGTTYINIIVKVGDTIVLDVQYGITVKTVASSEGPDAEEPLTLSYVFDNVSNLTSVITTQENNGEKYSFTEDSVTAGEVEGSVLIYTSNKDTPGTQTVTVNGVTYTNYMQMNGATQSNGNRSFKIDLSSYVGQYDSVSIEVIGTCRVNGETITQILISSTNSNTSADSALAATSTDDVTDNYTPGLSLTYSATLEERSEYYITCSAHARIYAINITLYNEDGENTGDSGDTSDGEHVYPDSNDTVNVVWNWEVREETGENVGYVTVVIKCVECGEVLAEDKTSYAVETNNTSYWYAEVAEGNITYASMYRIPAAEESSYVEESFIVPMSSDGVTADSTTYSAGDKVVENGIFELVTVGTMNYSLGAKVSNSEIYQIENNNITFEDMNGVEHNPNQALQSGIAMASQITAADSEGTATEVASGTCDDVLEVNALIDSTVFIYLTLTNNSYNTNPSGYITYTINSGETQYVAVSSRSTVTVLTLTLSVGDVVKIGATHDTLNSKKDTAQTLYLWLFGAEGYSNSGTKTNYDVEYNVTFYTNQGDSLSNICMSVYNYSAVSAPVLPNVTGQYFAGWYMDQGYKAAYDFSEPVTSDLNLYAKWVTLDDEITYIEGAYESIAFEFTDTEAAKATIYYKMVSDASYTKMTDADAIRQLDDDTVRVDIMGLHGDEYYNVKILTSGNVELVCYSIYVASYDRSGYAHFNYDEGVGAYYDDGTLKEGTLVIYLTEENKNDVTDEMYLYSDGEYVHITPETSSTLKDCLTMPTSDDNYSGYVSQNIYGSDLMCGIGEILNSRRYSSRTSVGISKLCTTYGSVAIRVIGTVTAELVDGTSSYDIIGLTDYDATTNGGSEGDNGGLVNMYDCKNLTIEGVGEGAKIDGWGFHFNVSSSGYSKGLGSGFEARNLTFINYPEDALGMEGIQSGSELTALVERCWIHNNSFYSGYCEKPTEEDKADGDGSIDFKRGQYLTVSYNYFEDCHKTNLFGSDANTLQYNITMHHNFWYNCLSRMPLTRNANIHFYNNYVLGDNPEKLSYVMHARSDAYIYAEYNYFEGCQDVFLTNGVTNDKGETDTEGTIKSFNNVFVDCYYYSDDNETHVDGSVTVTSRTQKVENNCGYAYAGIDYSSFDTDPALFYYDVAMGRSDCYLTSAAQAKEDVIRMAGAFSSGR